MAEENSDQRTCLKPSGAMAWSLQPLPALDDRQFARWKGLVEQRTGLSITEDRRHHLQTSIGLRMRELGENSYDQYYRKIVDQPGGMAEWAILLDRITVQETRFFRDPDAFALVQAYLLEWVAESASTSIEAWSVGCSSGEEAYSLAIIIREVLQQAQREVYFGVTGTDISKAAVDSARRARYPERKLVNMAPELRERYLVADSASKTFSVTPEIRERACFSRLNVAELEQAPRQPMNIIYCQNMLIYFRRWRRKTILDELAKRLVPGGLMVLGMGEMTGWSHPRMERVADERCLAFRRKKE